MKTSRSEQVIRELFSLAGIEINGTRSFDIQVHDDRFYRRILSDSALGLGESYMDGWWDCDQLDELINRMLRGNLEKKIKGNWRIMLHAVRSKLFNLQNVSRAFQVGEQHYDVGNDLYQAMLDSRLNYTCGYWKDAGTLDEAQDAKLNLVCRKIGLEPGMSVLELGCGFGAFAGYAAERYGVHVTGVTVSRRQVELASRRYAHLPVDIRLADYRSVTGQFDRVISIGILEHVGYKNYRTYMETVNRTLKPDGIAFIHTIGRNESTCTANAWITRYIFPNGMLPSVSQVARAMEGLFVLEDLHNFGPDYDRTLMAWWDRFNRAWPELKQQYDQRFYRMWRFYLLSCAGGFRSRGCQLWQIVMTRPGTDQPPCRQE